MVNKNYINSYVCYCCFFVTALIQIKSERCPFLNDLRLFNSQSVNPDIWYKNDRFCSVADPLTSSSEFVEGMRRRVSYTNQFYPCCINSKENCPIFQKFDKLSSEELMTHYRNKWLL
jgi:hypothetical protein